MDDLLKRLRNASPPARGLPGSAETLLRDLTSGRRVPRGGNDLSRTRTPALVPLMSIAGAMVVALLVVLFVAIDRPAAVATTPDPLTLKSTDWTLSSLRRDVAMDEQSKPSPSSRLGATYEGWYLQMEEESSSSLIQPQRIISKPGADGTGTTVVLAGNPIDSHGQIIDPAPAEAVPPGTLLSEMPWTSDEYAVAFPAVPPATGEAMRRYLIDHLRLQGAEIQDPVAGGDYFVAAVSLMQTWTLDGQTQRALIEVLLDAPGLSVAGSTTDRGGREGVVLDVATGTLGNPDFREQIIIDPVEWRVLAVESAVVDGIPEYNVPAGAVTSYTLWREQ